MSARKIDHSAFSTNVTTGQTRLSLSANDVRIHKNGIEFHSSNAIAAWTEVNIDLQSADHKKVNCNGVIVSCSGNRQAGYSVSMLFTHITKHSQEILAGLSSSRLN